MGFTCLVFHNLKKIIKIEKIVMIDVNVMWIWYQQFARPNIGLDFKNWHQKFAGTNFGLVFGTKNCE